MIAISWWETAQCYLEEDSFSLATDAYFEATNLFQEAGYWYGYGRMVFSWCWNAPPEIPRVLLIEQAEQALSSVQRELPLQSGLHAQGNLCLGMLYRNMAQLPEAEQRLKAAIVQAQSPSHGDPEFLKMAYRQLGILYRDHQQPTLALEAFTNELHHELEDAEPNYASLASIYQNLAATAIDLDRHEEGMAWLRKGLAVRAQSRETDPKPHLIDLNTLAAAHYDLGQLDSAAHWFQFLLQTSRQLSDDFVLVQASTHMNLGVLYSDQGKYQASLLHLDSCAVILQNLPQPNLIGLGKLYLNMGSIYLEKGENTPARAYILQALEVHRQANFPVYSNDNGALYTNLSIIEEAPLEKINWLKKASRSYANQPLTQAQTMLDLAGQFRLIQELDSAEQYLSRAKQLILPGQQAFPDLPIQLMEQQALLARDRGQVNLAIRLLKTAFRQRKKLSFPNPLTTKPAFHLAEIYAAQAAFDSAHFWIQESLKALELVDSPIPRSTSIPSYPIERMERLTHLADIRLQLAWYSGKKEEFEHVHLLVDSTLSIYDDWLPTVQQTNTLLESAEQARRLNELGTRASIALWERHQDTSYLARAMQYASQTQGTVLQLRKALARQQGLLGIPDSLYQREHQLLARIHKYDLLLQQTQEEVPFDSIRWHNLRQQAFQLQQNYEGLQQLLSTTYPQYRQLPSPGPASVRQLQENLLGPSHALIQFLRMDSLGYQFLLTSSGLEFRTFRWDQSLDQAIALFRFFPDSNHSQTSWMEASHFLYQQLWQPLELGAEIERITIIPDGSLAFLPFESLVQHPDSANYRSAPYLMKNYLISYDFSLNSWEPPAPSKAPLPYGGFAPIFGNENLLATTATFQARDGYRWDQPTPLPGTKIEIQTAQQLIGGKIYVGEAASEATFKSEASQFQVLHLATHGLVHAQRPLQSRLLFGELITEDSAKEDGLLHTYEVLGLELQAELALLSACHTGYGPIINGEGPMSLAWAFAQAGCPATMVSLWQASDQATAKITQEFVRFLAEGYPKDEALRQAKLVFLDSPEVDEFQANPKFWASLVLLGDPAPLSRPTVIWPWVILGGLLVAGLGVLAVRTQLGKR